MSVSKRLGTLLLAPSLVFLTAMTLAPTIYLIYLSSLNWNLAEATSSFVGLQNYVNLLSPFTTDGSLFLYSVLFTIAYGVAVTALEFFTGLGMALLLNRENLLAKVTRSFLIVPLMMTPILLDRTWQYLFNPLLGPITYLFSLFGMTNIHYLDALPNVFVTLGVVDLWQWTPFIVLILLGGLLSLPKDQFEASKLDGAGVWRQFRDLTWPLLKPFFVVAILFRFIDSLKVFNKIYVLTAGGPSSYTYSVSYDIFIHSIGLVGNVGLSAAMSVTYLVIVLAMSAIFIFSFSGVILGKR